MSTPNPLPTAQSPVLSPDDISSRVEGDPQVQAIEAEEDQALKEREAANARLTADSATFDPEGSIGKPPEFTGNVPQDHFKDVMNQAPLLMGLAAVGGAFGRAHGVAMLQTTNAMMKGIVQGSSDAYSEARQKYDQQMEDFKAKQKTWLDVYKAYAAAYKGRIDADLRAQQGANAAVGVISKQAQMTKTQIGNTIKLSDQLKKTADQVDRHSHQDVTDAIRAKAAEENAATNAKRASDAAAARGQKASDKDAQKKDTQNLVLQQIGELEDIVKTTPGVTGLAGAVRRGFEWADSSVDSSAAVPATQFRSKMETMVTGAYRLMKEQGGRLGADERKKIEDAVEGVKMTSGKQQLAKLAELKEAITGAAAPKQGGLPILTPEQARTYPKGTKFQGTDGNNYTVQ
jgi:hypothetical protein